MAMRKQILMTIFFTSLICLCAYSAGAQAASGPKMALKEREFDCGEVREGETIEHTFSVLNQGDAPLEIAHASEGCPVYIDHTDNYEDLRQRFMKTVNQFRDILGYIRVSQIAI